jgi:hypothetical protein
MQKRSISYLLNLSYNINMKYSPVLVMVFFVVLQLFSFLVPHASSADETNNECAVSIGGVDATGPSAKAWATREDRDYTYFDIEVCGNLEAAQGEQLKFCPHNKVDGAAFGWWCESLIPNSGTPENSCYKSTIKFLKSHKSSDNSDNNGDYEFNVQTESIKICKKVEIHLVKSVTDNSEWVDSVTNLCNSIKISPWPPEAGDQVSVSVNVPDYLHHRAGGPFLFDDNNIQTNLKYKLTNLSNNHVIKNKNLTAPPEYSKPTLNYTFADPVVQSTYSFEINAHESAGGASAFKNLCRQTINVGTPSVPGEITPLEINNVVSRIDPTTPISSSYELCKQIDVTSPAYLECERCAAFKGLWSAVGCIKGGADGIIGTLIKIGLNIGGGIALLLILAGSFRFTTSRGDPKQTSEAKEMIQAAVIGLLFIIFSVTILQFIGADLLHIPDFADK